MFFYSFVGQRYYDVRLLRISNFEFRISNFAFGGKRRKEKGGKRERGSIFNEICVFCGLVWEGVGSGCDFGISWMGDSRVSLGKSSEEEGEGRRG